MSSLIIYTWPHNTDSDNLFQPPREQQRDGESRQKIRQFDPADLKNHQRNGARDQAGGGIDRINQSVRGEKRFRVKLAGERDGAEKKESRKRRQGGRPAEYFHETGHGQPVHYGFDRQQPKVTELAALGWQAIRHRAEQTQGRGAK